MKGRYFSVGWIALVGLGSGCLPDPAFPDEPTLTFISFDPNGGSGRELVMAFTDGDGDFGLNQSDTVAPHFCSTCPYHQNLHCEVDELRNGVWTWVPLDPEAGQVPFYYRIPRITPSGSNPSLNGTLAIDMPTWHLATPYDTMRFRIRIWDRALNASNEVVTPFLLKP
jgi:hypothetical protein